MLQHVLPCWATVVGENCSITGCSCACFCDFWCFLVRSLGGFCCACGLFLLQCMFLWLWLPLVPVSVMWLPLVPVPAPAPVLVGASALAPFLGLLVCDCCLLVMSLLGGSGLVDLQGLCCTPLCLLNCVFRKSDVPANFDVWVAVCFGCPWWMPTVLGTAWFSSSDFVPIL